MTAQRRSTDLEALIREREELQQQLRAVGQQGAAAAEQAAAAARRVQQLENALVLADSHLQKVLDALMTVGLCELQDLGAWRRHQHRDRWTWSAACAFQDSR